MSTPPDPSTEDLRAGLRPPQFGLRMLLIGVTLFCIFLAAAKWLGPAITLVAIVLLAGVLGHIAGNALGTQLRDTGSRHWKDVAATSEEIASRAAAPTIQSSDFAPPSKLTQRQSLGPIVLLFPVVGSAILAAVGGYWLGGALGEKATLGRMIFGVCAFAVIGAILGFLAGTFLKVLIGANVEAWRNGERSS
jgi:hypothetical protein